MTKLVKIRNVNPLGFVDSPILGRQGEGPVYAFCEECAGDDPPVDHEHVEVENEAGGKPGSGCLVPGEVVETTPEIAERLLEQAGNFEAVKSTSSTEKKG